MKSIKALFGLFVVIAGMYLAWKVIPPYFHNYQFQDEVDNQARTLSYSFPRKSEGEVRDIILKKAHELDIPLTSEQITVGQVGNELTISANYTVHVDIPIYPFDMHFSAASKNKAM